MRTTPQGPALVAIAVLAGLTLTGSGVQADEPSSGFPVLIRDVRIWDGTSDGLSGASSVFVVGNRIQSISEGRVDETAGQTVIEGGGRVLMPGLIDAHQHLSAVRGLPDLRNNYDWMYVGASAGAEAHKMLLRGFTSVRDIGGPTVGLARAIDEGRIPGPRIYSSGAMISQTSGHGDFRNYNDPHPKVTGELHIMDRLGWVRIADGPWEVTRAVRESLRTGATQIKLMAGGGVATVYDPIETVQFTPEELRAAVVAAENYETYVAVHAYTDRAIRQALDAGVRCIDHGMLIEESTIELMAEKGAFLSPQVYIFTADTFTDWFTEENRRKMRQVAAGLDKELKLAKKHGVKIVFGTDVFGKEFDKQNEELVLRLKWFTPLEILRQATSVAAELLALTRSRNPYKEGPLGVVEPGAYADLLIVEGNPLEDIRVLADPQKNLRLIMKNGTIYKNTLARQ